VQRTSLGAQWGVDHQDADAHRAVWAGRRLLSGGVYAVGGYDGTTFLNTVEAYSPSSNTWLSKAPMSTPREGPVSPW
jgi:hypothetical protein